mgnify:CR=1 FL=1
MHFWLLNIRIVLHYLRILHVTFQTSHVPPAPEWKLNEFTFNDFALAADEMVLAVIRIFKDLGLMKTCRIEYDASFFI